MYFPNGISPKNVVGERSCSFAQAIKLWQLQFLRPLCIYSRLQPVLSHQIRLKLINVKPLNIIKYTIELCLLATGDILSIGKMLDQRLSFWGFIVLVQTSWIMGGSRFLVAKILDAARCSKCKSIKYKQRGISIFKSGPL